MKASGIRVLLSTALTLLLTMMLPACENEDYPEKVYERDLVVGAKYSQFFQKGLNRYFFAKDYPDREVLHVITSEEELREIYTGKETLPSINFKSYMVIVGRANMKYRSFALLGNTLSVKDDQGWVNLYFDASEPCEEEYPQYFWGFYRKLSLKKIEVKKIIN